MALVVNFCEHLYEKLPVLKSFFFNVVFRNQNVVTLKELEQNPSLCEKVVGLYVNSNLKRNQEFFEFLEKLVNLKIICFIGAGFDSVDTEWAKSRGIRIGHSIQDGGAAANFGMALLLRLTAKKDAEIRTKILARLEMNQKITLQKLRRVRYDIKCKARHRRNPTQKKKTSLENKTKKAQSGRVGRRIKTRYASGGAEYFPKTLKKNLFPPELMAHDVTGNSIGIIGMGTIGYKLAIRAHAFEMKVLSKEEEAKVDAQFYSSLMDMLPLCDYVVITCALTPQTYHLIGHKELDVMKKTATLINIARADHKLHNFPNVIITPHCATNTNEAAKEVCDTAFKNMELGLRGEPMLSEVVLD
ncbi:uncharacterized protein LOC128250355 [Octopus bimaculoides]|uniref:uncharacterized protein LOC128250355 n=1 Tax=Octopus bimaculoides TaxID=37653 RepID=UPI0022E486D7|nr:uncharacterized protein LOC128250355 [Octopus bimaculoides]